MALPRYNLSRLRDALQIPIVCGSSISECVRMSDTCTYSRKGCPCALLPHLCNARVASHPSGCVEVTRRLVPRDSRPRNRKMGHNNWQHTASLHTRSRLPLTRPASAMSNTPPLVEELRNAFIISILHILELVRGLRSP